MSYQYWYIIVIRVELHIIVIRFIDTMNMSSSVLLTAAYSAILPYYTYVPLTGTTSVSRNYLMMTHVVCSDVLKITPTLGDGELK